MFYLKHIEGIRLHKSFLNSNCHLNILSCSYDRMFNIFTKEYDMVLYIQTHFIIMPIALNVLKVFHSVLFSW